MMHRNWNLFLLFFYKALPAPFFNCLTQNGDLGGKVEKLTTRLCQLIACAAPVTTRGCGYFFGQFWNLPCKMHWAPVIMVSFPTVPPPPVESETLEGQLKKGAGAPLMVWYIKLTSSGTFRSFPTCLKMVILTIFRHDTQNWAIYPLKFP